MLEMVRDGHYPRTVKILALAAVFVIALALFTNVTHPRQLDFISFWAAGKLALEGQAVAAYDIAAHKQLQLTLVQFKGLMPFAYPPPFLLLVTPFALLPYPVSTIVWVVLTFALYIIAARTVSSSAGWSATAFPPVLVNGITGQNGLLTGALFIFGMSLLKRRPLWAGFTLGCLIIKPHLAILLPVALAAGGHWRAFAGAAASSVGLLLIGAIVFGIESYREFVEQMPLFSSIAADGLVGWHKMASVYASMRLAGTSAAVAWALHILIAGAAAVAVWVVWRSKPKLETKVAMLAAASVLVTPYLYLYDTVLLLLPFLWLARTGEDPRVLALLWCIPFTVVLQNWGFNQTFNPAPLLPIALLFLIGRRLRQSGTGQDILGPARSI